LFAGPVPPAARTHPLPRSKAPSEASLNSLLLSQLALFCQNDAADGGLCTRAAAALHLLRFRRMALFCRSAALPTRRRFGLGSPTLRQRALREPSRHWFCRSFRLGFVLPNRRKLGWVPAGRPPPRVSLPNGSDAPISSRAIRAIP